MEVKKTIDKRKKFYDKPKKVVDEKDKIWDEKEVKQFPLDENETRPRPEFDIMYK